MILGLVNWLFFFIKFVKVILFDVDGILVDFDFFYYIVFCDMLVEVCICYVWLLVLLNDVCLMWFVSL